MRANACYTPLPSPFHSAAAAFLGANWNGVDGAGNPWQCLTGNRQSPINLPSLSELGKLHATACWTRQGAHLPCKPGCV